MDLAEILTGKPATTPRTPAPAAPAGPVDPDTDYLVRTVYGEASGEPPEGRKAVAAVILNRARKAGRGARDIVLEPGQFEPWGDRAARRRMERLSPQSPEYQAILADISPVLSGDDPTGGATHFYAPKAQRALGRAAPQWDDGSGFEIGNHRFFRLAYGGQEGTPDLAAILGVQTDAPAQPRAQTAPQAPVNPLAPEGPVTLTPEQEARYRELTATGPDPMTPPANPTFPGEGATITRPADGTVVNAKTGEPLNPAQTATYNKLNVGGMIDPNAAPGSERLPLAQVGDDIPTEPGTFYVTTRGELKMVPLPRQERNGPMTVEQYLAPVPTFGAGLQRGGLDVLGGVGRLIGPQDSALGQSLEADRLVYEARNRGDPAAMTGRFVGQVAASVPLLEGGGAVLAPLARGAGAAGEFVSGGYAGGSKLLKGLSRGVRGVTEGAVAGGLLSGANDAPVGEQVGTGALVGGLFGAGAPLAYDLGRGVTSKLTGRASAEGSAPVMEQMRIYGASQGLPVAVPMTPGQIAAAPAMQIGESALLKGVRGDAGAQIMREFQGEQQGALRGNVDAIASRLAGGALREPGEGGAMVSERLNALYDESRARVRDAYRTAEDASETLGATIPAAERANLAQRLRQTVRHFDPEEIGPITRALDTLDKPEGVQFTPRDIFDLRKRLSTSREQQGPIGAAAGSAVREVDAFLNDALESDLIAGDPAVVESWRKAIAARRDHGRLFEGRDAIEKLTKRVRYGEGEDLANASEDVANYLFNRSGLGFVGKRNLNRDLVRLKTVLGPDSPEWGALRSEVFGRVARAGEGAPEGGSAQFSGQNFFKAWNKFKTEAPQMVRNLFSPEERAMIDDFAEIAQRVTSPVRGGDNASNTAFAGAVLVRKALQSLGTMAGGAVGSTFGAPGAAAGAAAGKGFDTFMKDISGIMAARRATSGKFVPVSPANPKASLDEGVRNALTVLDTPTVVTGANPLLNRPADRVQP